MQVTINGECMLTAVTMSTGLLYFFLFKDKGKDKELVKLMKNDVRIHQREYFFNR